MKKHIFITISMLLLGSISGDCSHSPVIPTHPQNLAMFNSRYDDYNLTAPNSDIIKEGFIPFAFSSNRNSEGKYFDIVNSMMSITFTKSNGSLSIEEEKSTPFSGSYHYKLVKAGSEKVNSFYSSSDKLGPFMVIVDYDSTDCIMLFSSNQERNHHDIEITYQLKSKNPFRDVPIYYRDPLNLSFVNSPYDDQYPSFLSNSENTEIYFSSNREQTSDDVRRFNIYKTSPLKGEILFDKLTNDQTININKIESLCSDQDDNFPFILDKKIDFPCIVFSSNRKGGFGGYDLYYSFYIGGEWQAPRNFGSSINTKHDEYRPVAVPLPNFSNDMMMFSSNRPGGKGGIDLYYVGTDILRRH